jgi:glyoxylase-like metal-dependent hydrolase (beta-lactamase superfamily II)
MEEVNAYLVGGGERSLIVDPGLKHEVSFAVMQQALREFSIDLRRTDFFITHAHLDHIGLVVRLKTDESQVYIGRREMEHIEFDWEGAISFALSYGFPQSDLASLLKKHPWYTWTWLRAELHFPFHVSYEQDKIHVGDYTFTVIETPGHSAGHLCLYEPAKKMLISGDHILEGITPTTQRWSPQCNPLLDYITNLEKIEALDVGIVLPGHGDSFTGCKERIRDMQEHRAQRTSEILSLLGQGPSNCLQARLTDDMEGDYDSWDRSPVVKKWFSTGETIAHLCYLEKQGLSGNTIAMGASGFYFGREERRVSFHSIPIFPTCFSLIKKMGSIDLGGNHMHNLSVQMCV